MVERVRSQSNVGKSFGFSLSPCFVVTLQFKLQIVLLCSELLFVFSRNRMCSDALRESDSLFTYIWNIAFHAEEITSSSFLQCQFSTKATDPHPP